MGRPASLTLFTLPPLKMTEAALLPRVTTGMGQCSGMSPEQLFGWVLGRRFLSAARVSLGVWVRGRRRLGSSDGRGEVAYGRRFHREAV